jgi:AcrR family transcriptional regulator
LEFTIRPPYSFVKRSEALMTRKLQAAQTETELKAAARVVFEHTGYLNAKITDITRQAGRAAGSFYTHFDSKEALLEALLADVLAEADVTAARPAHDSDFTKLSAVRWHIQAYWHFYRAHRPVLRALRQAAIVNDHFADRLRELTTPDRRHMAGHLVEARDAGATLPGDPMVVALAIEAILLNFAAEWIDGNHPDDEGIDTLSRFVHAAIQGSSDIS